MKNRFWFMVIGFSFAAAVASADDVQVEAAYGGVVAAQRGEFVGPGFEASTGNSYFASAQLMWRPVYGGLKPFLGVDYMWSGKSTILEGSTSAISLGLGYSFNVGHARGTVLGGLVRYFDKFSGALKTGDSVSQSSKSTGGVLGFTLAFQFLNGIDTVMGYKMHLMEHISYDGVFPSGEEYSMSRNGVSHILFGGIRIRL